MEVSVNYLAVLLGAVLSMVVGSIWYGPVFGKVFSKAMGMENVTEEQKKEMMKGMWKTYLMQFLASFLLFYVLAWVMSALNQLSLMGGLTAGFWVWLGFIMPVQFGRELWGGKMTLFWLGAGNMLITTLVGGMIIGYWA